jgi:predicted O-methyltransferase YrrM
MDKAEETPMDTDYQQLVARKNDDLIQFPPLTSNAFSLSLFEKSLLGHLLLLARPKSILELGVYQGLSTEFICEFLDLNKLPGTLFGFDLAEQIAPLRKESRKINRWESQGRLTLIPGTLPDSLKDWIRESRSLIDFALVDATHNYWSVSGELDLLWSALAPDGYIVCHDYAPNYQGVREAIDHFISKHHDAMAAPLVSTDGSLANNYRSSLLVLRRRPYAFRQMTIFQNYKWPQVKKQLLNVRLVGSVWSFVRPLFKRNPL